MIAVIGLCLLAVAPQLEALPDGGELLVLSVPKAKHSALRVLVRAGSSSDPAGKEGLAHLVGHLVLHGSRATPGEDLVEKIKAAGGELNVYTAPDHTWFVLDAPAPGFEAAARSLLEVITNPALDQADLPGASAGLAAEHPLRPNGNGLSWSAEQALFPSASRGAPVIGTEKSRAAINLGDVVVFYQHHYLPAASAFIISGGIDRKLARDIVDASSRWPPSLPNEAPVPEPAEPKLPASLTLTAGPEASVIGYALGRVGPRTCVDLSALVRLRLGEALAAHKSKAANIQLDCESIRGHAILASSIIGPSEDLAKLEELADKVLSDANPATAGERKALQGDRSRDLAGWEKKPGLLADAFIPELARPITPAEPRAVGFVLAPHAFEAAELAKAQKSLRAERRLRVQLGPAPAAPN